MLDAVREWFADAADASTAPALALLVDGIGALDPAPEATVGAFGARFDHAGETLCEISIFGTLFIVRVGPQHAVEYRVRDLATALEALDHVVRQHLRSANPAPS